MKTPYDWITVIIFAGLVTRFLHQSSKPEAGDDSMWHYLVPCVGCAVTNWLGNDGRHVAAVGMLVATLAYIFYFLGPAGRPPREH